MVVSGVDISVFLYKLLCTLARAILRLARRLIKAAGKAVVVGLFKLLSLLSLPIYLFPQLHRHLVKVIGPKSLLLSFYLLICLLLQLGRHLVKVTRLKGSNAYITLWFDNTFFAIII